MRLDGNQRGAYDALKAVAGDGKVEDELGRLADLVQQEKGPAAVAAVLDRVNGAGSGGGDEQPDGGEPGAFEMLEAEHRQRAGLRCGGMHERLHQRSERGSAARCGWHGGERVQSRGVGWTIGD